MPARIPTASALTLARNALDDLAYFDSVPVDHRGNLTEPEYARRVIDTAIAQLTEAQHILGTARDSNSGGCRQG